MTADQMTASLREWAARDGLAVQDAREIGGAVYSATLVVPQGKPWSVVIAKAQGYTPERLADRYRNARRAFANGH